MTNTRRTVNGVRLRELREDAGHTLDSLADAMKRDAIRRGYVRDAGKGSSGAYIGKIEGGHVQPSTVYLRRLADILGVDLNAFSTREPIEDAA